MLFFLGCLSICPVIRCTIIVISSCSQSCSEIRNIVVLPPTPTVCGSVAFHLGGHCNLVSAAPYSAQHGWPYKAYLCLSPCSVAISHGGRAVGGSHTARAPGGGGAAPEQPGHFPLLSHRRPPYLLVHLPQEARTHPRV